MSYEIAPEAVRLTVSLAPVVNILNTFGVLTSLETNPGIENWIARMGREFPPELQAAHDLIFRGLWVEALANAVEDVDSMPRFTDYLAAFAALDPVAFRDRCVYWLVHSPHRAMNSDNDPPPASVEPAQLVADRAAFVAYVNARGKSLVDEAFLHGLHELLREPAALHALVLGHLRRMWQDYGLVEWERTRPALEETVAALQQIDIAHLAPLDAIQVITGRNLRTLFDMEGLNRFQQIILIPSRHNGPYITWMGNDTILRVVFSARVPQSSGASLLDTPELLNRLNALADSARLDILLAIKRHGELSTQQIMDIFALNKSAASRHLKQLRANELIAERRDVDNKTKFYHLNPEAVESIGKTLDKLLVR